jgi:hypothetical protein
MGARASEKNKRPNYKQIKTLILWISKTKLKFSVTELLS